MARPSKVTVLTVTDRAALDSPELGIEITSALHHLYPTQFKLEKVAALVANTETLTALNEQTTIPAPSPPPGRPHSPNSKRGANNICSTTERTRSSNPR